MITNAHTPIIIDVTKATLAKFGDEQVLRDASGNVFALCPLFAEPIIDGQFSYAAIIQRAVNAHDELVAALRMLRDADDIARAEGYCSRMGDEQRACVDAALAKLEAAT